MTEKKNMGFILSLLFYSFRGYMPHPHMCDRYYQVQFRDTISTIGKKGVALQIWTMKAWKL